MFVGVALNSEVVPISSLSSLFDNFSVGWFRSKILALPEFGYFSVEHARSVHGNAKIF